MDLFVQRNCSRHTSLRQYSAEDKVIQIPWLHSTVSLYVRSIRDKVSKFCLRKFRLCYEEGTVLFLSHCFWRRFRGRWLNACCGRQINKMRPGGRKSVIYRAPCGRRLRSIEETDDFLSITDSQLFIDHFCYDPWLHVHTDFVPVKVGHDIIMCMQ